MRQVSGLKWNSVSGGQIVCIYFVFGAAYSSPAGFTPSNKYLNAVLPPTPPHLHLDLPAHCSSQNQPHPTSQGDSAANMASQNTFQPTPPIRTNTAGSQTSVSSGQLSPTSPTSRATSPTEQSFFGAITARVRGRSRSRSRDASRRRSKSPMISPPRHMLQQHQQQQPQPQHISIATSEHQVRPSLQNSNRRSTAGSDPWRGRHSNEWLFGGWSATETARNLVRRQS